MTKHFKCDLSAPVTGPRSCNMYQQLFVSSWFGTKKVVLAATEKWRYSRPPRSGTQEKHLNKQIFAATRRRRLRLGQCLRGGPPGPNGAGCAGGLRTGVFVDGLLSRRRTRVDRNGSRIYYRGVVLGTPFVVTPSSSSKDGLSYGILAGYNYQVGHLVLGVEGDSRAGPLARYATPRSPAIFLRRTANGAARSVDGSVTLPIARCSI